MVEGQAQNSQHAGDDRPVEHGGPEAGPADPEDRRLWRVEERREGVDPVTAEVRHTETGTFGFGRDERPHPDDVWWLSSLLPLVTATVALGLGWVVLRARRPDPLVGLIYVIVGLPVVFAMPIWMTSGVALQEWLPLPYLLDGQQLAVWESAAIAVIGLAELARWVGSRRTQAISRPSVVISPHSAPDATPL